MQINGEMPSQSSQAKSQTGCINHIVVIFTLLWILSILWIRQAVTLTATITPDRTAQTTALIGAGVQLVLILPPLLLLSIYWPHRRYRLVFRGWLAASGLGILTAPIFLTGPDAAQLHLLLQIIALILLFALLMFWKTEAKAPDNEQMATGQPAPVESKVESSIENSSANASTIVPVWSIIILIGAALLYPWLAWGALGSVLDTVLGVAFCLAFGLVASLILSRYLLPALQSDSNLWGDYFLGGLSIGMTLAILAGSTAFAFGAVQQFLLIVLPGLGWIIIAIVKLLVSPAPHIGSSRDGRHKNPGWRALLPVATLIGLAAAGPVLFLDPDELALIISASAGEVLLQGYAASFASMAIGLALGLALLTILGLCRSRAAAPSSTPSNRTKVLATIAALFTVILGIGIYFSIGQPGWYGERMFVILSDQADVSAANDITDYQQRRQFVYDALVKHANTTQAGLRQSLDRLGLDYTPYYLVNAIEVGGNPLLRLWLNTRPEVDRILDSPRMRPLPEQPPLSIGSEGVPTSPQWNLTDIGADRVWTELGITGQDIIIGQSDSGVQGGHPELASAYRGMDGDHNYNWFDPWYGRPVPTDIGGHGTHTLGSILGENTGVAPGAQWIACVNLARNLGNPALYLDCWQFMLAPFPLDGDPLADGKPERGAHVLNNSWGCPDHEGCDDGTFAAAAKALSDAGVFVVASAGNDGPTCGSLKDPPPIYANALAVGAIDQFGEIASFSSIGSVAKDGNQQVKPDLVAPGVDVLSSFPGSTYEAVSGTSMAGPHVVGVVALMWSANPTLIGDIQNTADLLRQTAKPYTGSLPPCPGAADVPSTAVGYGIVDAYAAVNAAIQFKK